MPSSFSAPSLLFWLLSPYLGSVANALKYYIYTSSSTLSLSHVNFYLDGRSHKMAWTSHTGCSDDFWREQNETRSTIWAFHTSRWLDACCRAHTCLSLLGIMQRSSDWRCRWNLHWAVCQLPQVWGCLWERFRSQNLERNPRFEQKILTWRSGHHPHLVQSSWFWQLWRGESVRCTLSNMQFERWETFAVVRGRGWLHGSGRSRCIVRSSKPGYSMVHFRDQTVDSSHSQGTRGDSWYWTCLSWIPQVAQTNLRWG